MSEPTPGPVNPPRDHHSGSHAAVPARSAPARWIAPLALALSLAAAAAAGWALLKPAPAPMLEQAPAPAPGPVGAFAGNPAAADPKAEACRVARLVIDGVSMQSQVSLGPEPLALETVAANTRLAMVGGAAYLRQVTPSNTPPELAEPISVLAGQLQDVAQHFFVGQVSALPEQGGRLAAASATSEAIVQLCGPPGDIPPAGAPG